MDLTRDENGAELYRIANLYDAPPFVKTAKKEELRPVKPLPQQYYGDPVRSLFPCHTKAATWTSYALFLEKKADFRRVDAECIEERILHAAEVHGITKSCGLLKEAVARRNAPESMSELPDEAFAVTWANDDGTKERYMPLRNAVEIKTAANWYYHNHDRFLLRSPYEFRRDIADRIMQKAAEHGVSLGELSEWFSKNAGYGTCSAKDAAAAIRERVALSLRGGLGANTEKAEQLKTARHQLTSLARTFEEKPAQLHSGDTRVKLASILDRFDTEAGLKPLIRDGKLDAVEDILFSLTREKLAAAKNDHTHTTTGNIYRLEDIERIKLATVRDVLGEDVAKSLTHDGFHISGEKAAEVVPTLPRGDATLFDHIMSEAGMNPVAKQASATSTHLSHQFLREMAKQHKALGCPVLPAHEKEW